jgi:hypothetical protein
MLHSSKSWAERPCRAVAATDSTQSGEKWDYTILHLKTVLGLGDCASYTSAHRPLARFSGMSEMKLAATIPVRADARAAMLCLLLVSACGTQGVRLSDTDRASLDNQPATQVLHYATPLPRIKAGNKSRGADRPGFQPAARQKEKVQKSARRIAASSAAGAE